MVKVSYDPKNHKTEIQIEGDPRYDPKIIRASKKQQRAAETQALLSGAPAAAASGVLPQAAAVQARPRGLLMISA
jgi:hypothetical protein